MPRPSTTLDAQGSPPAPERRALRRAARWRDAAVLGPGGVRRPAVVRDVSAGGLGLLLSAPLHAGDALTVLVRGWGGRPLALASRVVWSWPKAGRWAAGCRLTRVL